MDTLEVIPSDNAPSPRSRPKWNRPLLVAAALLAVATLLAATWGLAAVVQSPAQREANAAAPAPQPVFAEVTSGVLADQRSYSGTLVYRDETGYAMPASVGAVRSVVTARPPAVGGEVDSGDVLTEVNTRPVFAVESPFDFFRDIGVGNEGADVLVLQEALVDRGYLAAADGQFGSQTARAVARWYQDAGYQAPTRQRGGESASGSSSATGSPYEGSDAEDSNAEAGSQAEPASDAFVPVGELLAISTLPATVIAAPAIGTHVGEDGANDVTLGTSTLVVRAEVPSTPEAGTEGVALGDPVTVVYGSEVLEAVVTTSESQPQADDGAPTMSVITAAWDTNAGDLDADRGETVTIQVLNALISDKSLIVPTAAVVSRGEGRGVVVRRQADGTLVEVPVAVAGTFRGMTAIAPDVANRLAEGDEVRVG